MPAWTTFAKAFTPTLVASMLLASCATGANDSNTTRSADPAQSAGIEKITQSALAKYKQRSVIVRVVKDGVDLYTGSAGESMSGVPATVDMHTRNGAFAFTYIGQTFARMADENVVALDDPISKWLPELRKSNKVTIRNLLNMTSGYPDYVRIPAFLDAVQLDPYKQWTDDQLIAVGMSVPDYFEPGTNWAYSHTNYVILGKLLAKITGKSTADVLAQYVLDPMDLANTSSNGGTPIVPTPALHAFTSERRTFLKVPPRLPFYEEATYWNPSWTTANGAVQTSNIFDITTSMAIVGSGAQVSPEMYQQQIGPALVGFGKEDPTGKCSGCRQLTNEFNYGFGVVRLGDWISQTKSFSGSSASSVYLPSERLTISVIANTAEDGFASDGAYLDQNASLSILNELARFVAPNQAPPIRK